MGSSDVVSWRGALVCGGFGVADSHAWRNSEGTGKALSNVEPNVREAGQISVVMFDAAYPPPVVGGKEKQAQLLSEALARKGVRIAVLSFLHGSAKCTSPVDVRRFPPGFRGVLNLLSALWDLRPRFDILHVHTPSRIGILVAAFGYLLGYRIVFKLPNEHLVSPEKGIWPRIRILLARRIHTTVCLEEDSVRRLEQAGVPRRKIFVANNGVLMQGDPYFLRHDHGSSSCARYEFLFIGRLVPQKRCEDAIEAFRRSGLHREGAVLKIIGDGPLRADLEASVARADLSHAVSFCGQVSNPLDYLRAADCLVLCSDKEGMPNVVLEAMSVGVPVVATRVGAVPRMIGHLDGASIFDVGDIDRLASLMQALRRDHSLARDYSQSLYEECKKRFQIDAVAESYMARYQVVERHK